MAESPLAGRVALVTGMSRRIGIAWAIAERLAADGAEVFATGWSAHDAEMPWGADPGARPGGERIHHEEADMADPATPAALVDRAVERHGRLDIVIAAHARSSHAALAEVSMEDLDACWAVNARASLMLAQRFGQVADPQRGGSMVLFTSGQHLGPMGGEIAYAVSKGAIQQMTLSVASELSRVGITVNCVNPGPVDTGWADDETRARLTTMFPGGRWGQPSDVANLVAFLVGDQGRWITGQTINSEGGFGFASPAAGD